MRRHPTSSGSEDVSKDEASDPSAEVAPTSQPGPAGAAALVGAWGDVEDEMIDAFMAEILRSREDMGRHVENWLTE